MNTNYYNYSFISELRNFTARENVYANEQCAFFNKLKDDVFNMVSRENESMNLQGALRYVMHLRNELTRNKDLWVKKKQQIHV